MKTPLLKNISIPARTKTINKNDPAKILRKKIVIFGATDYRIFFFEESARQTLVSTV